MLGGRSVLLAKFKMADGFLRSLESFFCFLQIFWGENSAHVSVGVDAMS